MKYHQKANSEQLKRLAQLTQVANQIDPSLFQEKHVKKGLRDLNGKGVLAGLTNISTIESHQLEAGKLVPCDGILEYRGMRIQEIVNGYLKDDRFGFEEVTYLLLFGHLPTASELSDFEELLASKRTLPTHFVRDVIMKAPSKDIMNNLSRSVLTLASYDATCDDTSIENVLDQSLMLISLFPLLCIYGYLAYNHYENKESFFIHYPDPTLSTAENILRLLRPDKQYTQTEAKVLDLALVLHMEHGGGNNSTFTTHVVSSAGTDTYSVITAALSSLKGPKHGGANSKVIAMMDHLNETVYDATNPIAIKDYLRKLLRKETFDQKGLIYGIGHAVYSISDPRAELFRDFVAQLADEKGLHDAFTTYSLVEKLAPEVIAQERTMYKGVSANVDFYSGFVYRLLGIPEELFTPMFAIARIVGWSAHRLEELTNANKIIRPAYDSVSEHQSYRSLPER